VSGVRNPQLLIKCQSKCNLDWATSDTDTLSLTV